MHECVVFSQHGQPYDEQLRVVCKRDFCCGILFRISFIQIVRNIRTVSPYAGILRRCLCVSIGRCCKVDRGHSSHRFNQLGEPTHSVTHTSAPAHISLHSFALSITKQTHKTTPPPTPPPSPQLPNLDHVGQIRTTACGRTHTHTHTAECEFYA